GVGEQDGNIIQQEDTPASDDQAEHHEPTPPATDARSADDNDAADAVDDQAAVLERYGLTVTPDDDWLVYIVSNLQIGLISQDTTRLVGHVGLFRPFVINDILEDDHVIFYERKAILIKSSGNIDQDYKTAEQLLETV